MTGRMTRFLLSIILVCAIAFNSFTAPALAGTDSNAGSFLSGFWTAVGGVVGTALGTVATCYVVDAVVFPFAPPVAVYLAPMCSVMGGAAGATGGAAIGANAFVPAR